MKLALHSTFSAILIPASDNSSVSSIRPTPSALRAENYQAENRSWLCATCYVRMSDSSAVRRCLLFPYPFFIAIFDNPFVKFTMAPFVAA